jgi:hypothetical protein
MAASGLQLENKARDPITVGLSLVDETLADSDVWAYSCSDVYPNDLGMACRKERKFFLLDPMTPVFPPDRYTGGSGWWGREGCLIAIHAGTRWLVGQNLEAGCSRQRV